jgi:NADH-quinone oxidoreductase subunit C
MLPDNLKEYPAAAGVAEHDPDAIVTGKFERGELTLEIQPARIVSVCRFLKEGQAFDRLSTVAGVDRYPGEPRFEIVYHLHSTQRNQRLRLKCRVSSDDAWIDSVTSVWRAANWYERETYDLFGVTFRNHPGLRRIMLPENWEGHPLRKNYSVTGDRV